MKKNLTVCTIFQSHIRSSIVHAPHPDIFCRSTATLRTTNITTTLLPYGLSLPCS
jgi:hypothetical protein